MDVRPGNLEHATKRLHGEGSADYSCYEDTVLETDILV